MRKLSIGSSIGKAALACALTAVLAPASALAIDTPATATPLASADAALATQADAAKANYSLAVSANFTDVTTVTFSGYTGGRMGRMTIDAMQSPQATIIDANGAVIAEATPIGEDGAVAVTANVAVGTYTAVVSSDNFNDVTVVFTYPATQSVTIGNAKYWFFTKTDDALAFVDDAAKTDGALTDAGYANIAGTDVWYQVAPGSQALSGTVYGMDMTASTSYTDFYTALLGTPAASADYDAITSATGIVANAHYGYLSELVARDLPTSKEAIKAGTATEADMLANKLTGAYCTPATLQGDQVTAYVEASILKAAGWSLTEDQAALAASIRLNGNATTDPTTVTDRVAVDTVTASGFFTSYSYFDPTTTASSKMYGEVKFVIRPTAGANGADYSWADFYKSLYAGTFSDGTTTVGMAPWIDLYAEEGHGAVEMSICNGLCVYNTTSKATVNRFAAFYDSATGRLKAGNYTITLYAAGYNPLSYTFKVGAAVPSDDLISIQIQNADIEEGATATVISYSAELAAEGMAAEEGEVYAENAQVNGNVIALDKQLAAGPYKVTIGKTVYTFVVGEAAVEAYESEHDIANATVVVAGASYTGKPLAPAVSVASKGGTQLVAGTDFTVKYANNTEAGNKAEVTVTGAGAYTGSTTKTFTIAKAANTLSVKAKAKALTAKAKKKTTFNASKALVVKGGQGKITYAKANKAGKAKIKVAKNGKITVKKGLKKGTYNVKVKVSAAGDANYDKGTKSAVVKIQIK